MVIRSCVMTSTGEWESLFIITKSTMWILIHLQLKKGVFYILRKNPQEPHHECVNAFCRSVPAAHPTPKWEACQVVFHACQSLECNRCETGRQTAVSSSCPDLCELIPVASTGVRKCVEHQQHVEIPRKSKALGFRCAKGWRYFNPGLASIVWIDINYIFRHIFFFTFNKT